MLLLHDSLGYSSAAHFQGAGYTIIAGATPTFGLPHERASATSIAQLSFQTPTIGPGSDPTCVVGVLANILPLVYETVPFLEIGSSSGTQIRATMEKAAGGWRLFFYRGSASDLLLTTPFFSHSGWVFLEVKAVVADSAGSIVVRLDETEVARVEGVDTREHAATLWDRLRFFAHTSFTVKLADIYACDGRAGHGARFSSFLGKVTHSKLLLGEHTQADWAPIPVLAGKARLSILAGQSNMTGRITATSSANWTNPNSRIRIWNRLAGVPAFQTLSATVNSACAYLPTNVPLAGPEMRFAELLSAHYASSGDSSVPNHYLVKGVQDGSFLFPVTPDYSWNVSVGGGLYSRLLTDITNAVTALGGWSQVGEVDLFWLQGESDAIYTASASTYRANLRLFLASILADIGAHGPRLTAHLINIHPDLYPASAPDSLGYYYKGLIREVQGSMLQQVKSDLNLLGIDLHCRNIEIGSCQISGDLTHLTEAGYDRLGGLMFDSWKSSTQIRRLVSDYEDLSDIDSLWVGTASSGKSLSFSPVSPPDANNSPVLAASGRHHSSATSPGLLWSTKAVGSTLFQNLHAAPAAPWHSAFSTSPVIALPEHLSLEVGVFT